MIRLRWLGVLVVCSFLLNTPAAHAQPGQIEVLRLDAESFPAIEVELIVRDSAGRSVTGLSFDDLAVSEEGATITAGVLEELPQPPVAATVGIVFDAAQSLGPYVNDGRIAVEALLGQLQSETLGLFLPTSQDGDSLRPLEAPDFVPPDQKNTLINALRRLQIRSGETKLYPALAEAIATLGALAGERGGAAVLVLVSDGEGNDATSEEVSEVLDLARSAGVRIVAIGLGTNKTLGTPETGERLSALASATAGTYLRLDEATPARLGELYQAAFPTTSVSHYRLRYESVVRRDGKEHALTVSVRNGTETLGEAEVMLLAPEDTLRLRPLTSALLIYFMFAFSLSLALVAGVTVIIRRTMRNLDTTGTRR